jgi:hypothetical protein
MTEFVKTSLYPGSSLNILTPQLQVPIAYSKTENIKKEHLMDTKHFVNFTH